MNVRAALLLLAVPLAAVLSGCTADDGRTTVTVAMRAGACVDGGARCFDLGVPEARVELRNGAAGPVVSGATDENGRVTLEPAETGHLTIVVTSPLIVGGRKEVSTMVAPGSWTDQSIRADLDVAAIS